MNEKKINDIINNSSLDDLLDSLRIESTGGDSQDYYCNEFRFNKIEDAKQAIRDEVKKMLIELSPSS